MGFFSVWYSCFCVTYIAWQSICEWNLYLAKQPYYNSYPLILILPHWIFKYVEWHTGINLVLLSCFYFYIMDGFNFVVLGKDYDLDFVQLRLHSFQRYLDLFTYNPAIIISMKVIFISSQKGERSVLQIFYLYYKMYLMKITYIVNVMFLSKDNDSLVILSNWIYYSFYDFRVMPLNSLKDYNFFVFLLRFPLANCF